VRRLGEWAAGAMVGAAATLLVVGQVAGVVWPWDTDAVADAAPPPAVVEAAPGAPPVDQEAVLAGEITASLAASEWPELTPGLDALGEAALSPEWTQDDCLNVDDENIDECLYGDRDAVRTAVLLGDSVGTSWLPGIRAVLEGAGWNVQPLTLGQCPHSAARVVSATGLSGWAPFCAEHLEWALTQVAQIQPELVILASSAEYLGLLESEAVGEEAWNEWGEGLTATLAALDTAPFRVVALAPPPRGENLQECATRFNSPQDCISSPRDGYAELISAERGAVEQFRGTALRATYVETAAWFCDARNRCPSFIGTTPVFADGWHLSAAYAARLAPVLAPVLLGQE
jgi:hypothetical protein